MRKHIFLFFSALTFLFACTPDNTPAGIIKPDKMVDLLTAVHLLDGSVFSIDPAPDSLYKYGMARYNQLFKTFNTDSGQFKRSFKYYTSRPAQLETMYEQISKTLAAKRDSITQIGQPNLKNALPKK